MKTYQDLEAVLNDPAAKADFVRSFIAEHVSSAPYKMAEDADRYDMQLNSGIDRFLDAMADIDLKLHNIAQKNPRPDTVKSNAFHRLNVQRVAYSLANGITLPDADEEKASLGESFDDQLYRLGYLACIHGESFGFWNADHLDIFKLTDFAPLYDEMDGTLRAGVTSGACSQTSPCTRCCTKKAVTRNTAKKAETCTFSTRKRDKSPTRPRPSQRLAVASKALKAKDTAHCLSYRCGTEHESKVPL